ncbi:MAG: Ribulose-phosphate 3-epimerase [Leptospirillum sp. Group II 'C75']|uniref:Ribulose-phosphate 3-epimerase n=2 Tax=Leptospirillum ferriphilum TaxID=178606 RepID=A0A059Y1A2_9BACT|nr:ribulose-phosphate 3-epimerase [Leptospirillum ferriphilum YSK]AKS24466.1 ribulose-phosphate 3-epimerase [Leptospirillum sp. Group II 'CF-1']EAY58164.1 MAG: Ribulose-phosphate 3-epimerase [Leptospirillum rubarum]EIJ76399.1 MAG: Ribulose-phosphate 3-epimerase [Leptospirillum sp. Group II 'C75']OOH71519.1 ribulose-phosphate 3-epimerase [Leptospirillum ferriphilum]
MREGSFEKGILIAPSLLAGDFARLGEEVKQISHSGADLIHLDVMDGDFVPNLTFGPGVIEAIRPYSSIPLEAHLMVWHPDTYLEELKQAGVDRVIVHQESDVHLNRLLHQIRQMGFSPGVALNPSSPANLLEDVLDLVDLVLVMTVNPGFGGQAFLSSMREKIAKVAKMRENRSGLSFRIEVDGGISPATAEEVVDAGADILVAGTAVFRNPPYTDAVHRLRMAALGKKPS